MDKCFPSAVLACQQVQPPCHLVCVDNRSIDGSVDYIRINFPSVEVIQAPENNFLFSLNDIVKERSEEVIIIANNDMRFEKDFISPLLAHFEDPDVFAVGAAIFDWDSSKLLIGRRYAEIRNYWLYKWWDYEQRSACFSLEASGGAAAIRRELFLDLGGFDDLYRPGYYEDFDLSFRAWEKGWKVIYEPKSIVYHRVSASMVDRYGEDGIAKLLYRNHLLFTAKNIDGLGFLIGFLVLLPIRAIRPLFTGYKIPLQGFLSALPHMPKAIIRRLHKPTPQKTTQEILKMLE